MRWSNPVIYGLAENIFVAQSSNKGGTWEGVHDGLKRGRKIFVRVSQPGENIANNQFFSKGAIPVDIYGNITNLPEGITTPESKNPSLETPSLFGAKDIYQEVFIRVYRSLPKFEFKSEFSTWLFRIATNVCLTHVERTGKHQTVDALESINPDDEESAPALQIVSNDLNPEQNLRNMELKAGIQKAVEQLTGKQKLVFTMKHFEGYKLREIADITGLNEGTVKRYLFDATIKMKNALRHFYN
ncbi:MAG: sigma-70 family RNA polymerase sigma factor [Ignavibacteriales bacterium]|nr:sigma-70 family RNA polymerase sigma factor [Ignavibacteriales bacterium]